MTTTTIPSLRAVASSVTALGRRDPKGRLVRHCVGDGAGRGATAACCVQASMAASRDEPAYACDCDRGMTTALPDFLESWFHINLESLLQIQSAGSPPIRRPGSRVDRRG